jgi:DNA-binding beta-propeller fold protein YncE
MLTRLLAVCLLSLTVISCGGGGASSSTPAPPAVVPGDFQLVLNQSAINLQQAGAPQFQGVRISPQAGFKGTVNLTVSGLPAGVNLVTPLPDSLAVSGSTESLGQFQMAASQTAELGSSTIAVTASSGSITHTQSFSLTVRQAAPFAMQVNPGSLSLTAGSQRTVRVSLTADAGTSPQLFLNVSNAPLNSGLNISSLQGLLTPSTPASVVVTAGVTAQSVQNLPVMITATDNSNNSAFFALPLTVTVPATRTPTPTRSTFFRTDQSPTGMVYDPMRKLLFVSVEILNEVVVLSAADGHQVGVIPVSFPSGIDIAADGSAVYVVSEFIGGVTTIDPNLLQVVGHSTMPASVSGLSAPATFFQVMTLSNGKVILTSSFDQADPLKPFFEWDPATDTYKVFGPIGAGIGTMARSDDHSKLVATGFVYDVTTDSFTTVDTTVTALQAVTSDGSLLAGTTFLAGSATGIGIYDSSLKLVASLPAGEFAMNFAGPRLFFSQDGTRLYVVPDQGIGVGSPSGNVVTVIDTRTFDVVGTVPAFSFGAILPFSGQWMTTFALDETGMLFGAAAGGVALLDVSSPTFLKLPLPGAFSMQPNLASLFAPTQGSVTGVGLLQGPMNLFVGGPPSSPTALSATNISIQSDNLVKLTLPRGSTAGAANVTLTRGDGYFAVRPDAVTFGPTILRVDADAGSTAGGDTIDVIGYGLAGGSAQVTIGGRPATIKSVRPAISDQTFPTERITVTTPSGAPGNVDVTVNTPSGSATAAGAYQYLSSVQVITRPGLLDAITYDKSRQRLYISNQDHNHVEIFDLGTNSFLTPVTVGNLPTALALTPDGALLAVLNFGDGTVSVIEPTTSVVKATYPVLTAADKVVGTCGGVAVNMTPAAPHRALVDVVCRSAEFNGGYHLIDLDSGSLSCTGVAGCSSNGTDISFGTGVSGLSSSADGTRIFLATSTGGGSPLPVGVLDLSLNTLVSGSEGDFTDASISGDGTVLAGNFGIFNGAAARVGIMAFEPDVDAGSQATNNVVGEKLNGSGSLLFYPQQSGVDIFDTHTGRLVRHVALPDPIPFDTNGMVLDETGTKMFLISNSGITIAKLFQAPLSLATLSPAAGPAGTTVVLRGSGYQNGATVSFGTTQIQATFIDSNTLQAIVPSTSPGIFRVSVSNPGGHQYNLDSGFTVK